MTEREESVSREMLELRRVVSENKKWQERCERLENERNDARLQATTAAEELAAFMDKWEDREEMVLELQQTIAALQSQLSQAFESSVSELPRIPKTLSRSSMVSSSSEFREPVEEEKSSNDLHNFLRYRRSIAQRHRKYENLEVPVLSLTPRQLSTASFDSHMSERFAFQAGQVLKNQIRNQQKSEFDRNKRLFGSIDLFVQVKLKEISQQTGPAAVPNTPRLAVACDLLDKLTATSSVHYVALSALRQELMCAIFEGYSVDPASSPEAKKPLLQAVRPLCEDYSSHTPYFVQVARLKKALAEAQTELNIALLQSSNKLRRLQLTTNAVNRMASEIQLTLLRTTFSAWASQPLLLEHRGTLCQRARKPAAKTAFIFRILFAWYRAVVVDKSDVFRKHVERESKKAEIFKAEAAARAKEAVVAKSSKQDLAVELLAWNAFSVQLAHIVLEDTRRMVSAMNLENLMDVRLLLDADERPEASVIIRGLRDAPPEEFLLRWLRHSTGGKVNSFGPECVSPETIRALCKHAPGHDPHSRPASRSAQDLNASVASSVGVGSVGMATPQRGPGSLTSPANAAYFDHYGSSPAQRQSTPPTGSPRPLSRSAGAHLGAGSPSRRREKSGVGGPGGVIESILEEMNRRTVQARAVTKMVLREGEDDAPRVELLCHLFPRAQNIKFSRGFQLEEELSALEVSFRKLESASALFIDGMDPVCKAIVQFHRKVNMEYDDLVRSLSMLQEGERKVLELRRHFETRIVFGFAEKIHLRSAEEIDSEIQLRNQRMMTLHSHKRRDSSEEDPTLLNAAKKRLVAFSFVDDVSGST